MAGLNPQPLPPGRISIQVPSKALYDLKAMQRITAQVLDKLGCGECHSGRILDFTELSQFVVNPESFEVHESFGGRF
jgi:hypothetical protein